MALGLLFSAVSMSLSSCGDDDDEPIETVPTEQEVEEKPVVDNKTEQETESDKTPESEEPKEEGPSYYVDISDYVVEPHLSKVVGTLHVDGRFLKDEAGNIVNLHGIAQT